MAHSLAYLADNPRRLWEKQVHFPFYKPGGRLFDTCAAGNLLMLAPTVWPYQPGEKRMTREDACILNRLAQLIAGPGAAEIVYKGLAPAAVDRLAKQAVKLNCCPA